jgi:hypothetical protein
MADDAKKEAELKYFERLNISVTSIGKIKELIKNDIMDTIATWHLGRDVDRQCYHIIGPAGLGKTQICYQIVEELTEEMFGPHNEKHPDNKKEFGCIMVKAPVLSRDDFIIPFPVVASDNETGYSFKMLYSDFVPKMKDTYGLFVIDEFSRGDHQLQQLLWQIQNEYSVHRHEFPKGWFVVSIDNPDDSEYSMDNLEDAAGLRRQLHLYSEVNAVDFLNHAIKNDFHPMVVEFIQTHPERLYDFSAQKLGSVYANPASYEKLSDIIWKMEGRRKTIDFAEIEMKAAGLLNTHMTRLFIEFARDKKDINPKDVFRDFRRIKPEIDKLLKEGNNSKLSELMVGFCTYMTTTMPEYDEHKLKNVLDFLLIMPIDSAALFISQIDSFDRSSAAFKYMTKIHMALLKGSAAYKKNFYDPVVKAGEGTL